MTTIANKFIKELKLISRDEQGFYDPRLANGWIARVRHAQTGAPLKALDATQRASERSRHGRGQTMSPTSVSYLLKMT